MTESTWKILKLDWKTPGKLLEFFSSKRVGTLFKLTVIFQVNLDWTVAPLALILHLFQRIHSQTASTFILRGPSYHPTSSVKALKQTQCTNVNTPHTTTVLQPFFPGPPGWASARREHLDFMVQGKINRGRHTDQPSGRHSVQTSRFHAAHLHRLPVFFIMYQCTNLSHWKLPTGLILSCDLHGKCAI